MRSILPSTIVFGFCLLLPLDSYLGANSADEINVTSQLYEAEAASGMTPLDKHLLPGFKHSGLDFAPTCSDAVFVRRIYLDMTGRLPPADVAQQFLKETSSSKRTLLIDQLLASEAYAVYWAMKWSDLLRVKSEFPINLWPNAAQAYHQWIYQSLSENKPYDVFARELLTSSGSNFRSPAVNFYRATQGQDPTSLARAAALAFMGTRLENWPEAKQQDFEQFFSRIAFKPTAEWKEEIVHLDPAAYSPLSVTTPDGKTLVIDRGEDPRDYFASWLTSAKNPWFARNLVNRQWAWLMGRGMIHEPDDIRADSQAIHPDLLRYLEDELVQSNYDMKHTLRLILNSRCYQQSSRAGASPEVALKHFAAYPLRRIEAEVLSDVLCDLTGTTEKYISMIPEPFTFIPDNTRTIAIADGSISSSFLQLFGRPARDTGYFTERDSTLSGKQALHLLNSSHISTKINRSKWIKQVSSGAITHERLLPVYLAFYSREPTDKEIEIAQAYFNKNGRKRWPAAQDLVWAMINSKEFLYNH